MKTYRYNKRSKEIHKIANLRPKCNAGGFLQQKRAPYIIPKGDHWRECRGFVAWWLLTFRGYNGCRWCWPEKNTG